MVMPFASNIYKYMTAYNQENTDDNISSSSSSTASINSSENTRKTTTFSRTNSTKQSRLSDIEAIRIKAYCVSKNEPKFMSIDPNITSYASLYLLLKKAFCLEYDFDVSYLLPKSTVLLRPEVFLSLTSDWDLDAAFHTASYPLLELKIEPVQKTELNDWNLLEPVETPSVHDIKSNHTNIPLSVSLKYDLTKKIGKVFDVFSTADRNQMVGQREWQTFFDSSGRLSSIANLKVFVYHGGLDPAVRHEAWPHLLGVFPTDLTSEERTRYLFMKTQVYKHLKETWMSKNPTEIESITHMVQKDVLRTDRAHPFFNVKEDHPNLVSLFNILATFAFNNPDISYCQGMSDLAAPLLVIEQDETLAYLCFCKVMERLRNNFLLKGTALVNKFSQLSLLLLKSDESLFNYLQEIEGGNLFFCYRMLLLELKREFPFTEVIHVMETIWSSVPSIKDDEEYEIDFYRKLLGTDKNNVNTKSFGDEETTRWGGLPQPRLLNDGSPFPLFLCLSILLMNKEQIMESEDYTMLAMHFDKLSRKHDSTSVLAKGKLLYADYLKEFLSYKTVNQEVSSCLESSHGTESTAAKC